MLIWQRVIRVDAIDMLDQKLNKKNPYPVGQNQAVSEF
jgi:hypothetical protein